MIKWDKDCLMPIMMNNKMYEKIKEIAGKVIQHKKILTFHSDNCVKISEIHNKNNIWLIQIVYTLKYFADIEKPY